MTAITFCLYPESFFFPVGEQEQRRVELRGGRRQDRQRFIQLSFHCIGELVLYGTGEDHFFPANRQPEPGFISRSALRITDQSLVLYVERSRRHFFRQPVRLGNWLLRRDEDIV